MCLMFQDICRSDVMACTWWLSPHLTENDRWQLFKLTVNYLANSVLSIGIHRALGIKMTC